MEQWPPELQDKQRSFAPAFDLIKKKEYSAALEILERNIARYPTSPTIDYEYVWGLLCLAELKRFNEMIPYYSFIVSHRFEGVVKDRVTEMERDWKNRILAARSALESNLEEPGAREALRELAKIESSPTGPFRIAYARNRQLAEYGLLNMRDGAHTYTTLAGRQQLLNTPTWSPERKLPLSFRQAAEIAMKHLKRNGVQDAPIESILLQQHEETKSWYYLVTFGEISKGKPPALPLRMVSILLDGTLLEPKSGDITPKYEE